VSIVPNLQMQKV